MNPRSLSFSIGAIGVKLQSTGERIGFSSLVGGFEFNGAPEMVDSAGGYGQFANASRLGRSPAELKLTLRECPLWLEEICKGVTSSAIAADAGSVSNVRSAAGSFTPGNFTVTMSGEDNMRGTGYIVATGASTANIFIYSNKGEFTFDEQALSGTAVALTGTGLSVALTAGTMTAGDQITFDFASGGAGEQLVVTDNSVNRRYHTVIVYSAIGAEDDAIWEYTFEKVLLGGMTEKLTDDAAATGDGIEIMGRVLARDPGETIYTKKRLSQTT